jgi:homoserine kinase
MLAANAITGSPLGQNKVLELAAGLEDHPANVSPALSGGLTITVATGSGLAGERVHVPDLRVVVALPDHDLPSVKAWKAFPRQVSLPMQSSTSDGSAWCFERRRAVTTIGWQILRRPVDYRRRRQKPSTRLVYVCSIFR